VPDPTEPSLTLRLFGSFEAHVNGAPLPRLRSRKGPWLLALLALRHGREVERDWLAGTLWPESAPTQAAHSLRVILTDLRRALGREARRLQSSTRHTLCLDLAGMAADVVTFDAAVARGDPASLAAAVALYRGPLLEGCAEEWAFQERQVREQAYLTALEALSAQAQSGCDPGVAEQLLRRVVAADPLRETAWRALMQVLATSGNYAAAAQVYRDLRLRLHREINAEPDPETTALFQGLRAVARGQAVAPPSAGRRTALSVSGAPLGAPDDLERAALGASLFPALPRLSDFPHNLPLQVTSFIGREREIEAVKQLLAKTRLLTLTGAGGTGKTRLALQVAADHLRECPDGVWQVELALLSDPALIPQTVASVLGVREEPSKPLTQTLVAALKPRKLLLVLDNCEHLLAACAVLADALLRNCPDVHLLATSREGLNIPGEMLYRLRSLSVPDPQRLPATPESLTQYEAVQLFVDRATTLESSFSLTNANALAVAQVCHRLDGIPLAIELAAARVKALPVEQISERLDDRFRLLTGGSRTALPRQQTLRALIDWSYDLLSEGERTLLRRLSVFEGGWTLPAAEAVCVGEGVEQWEVLDLLTSLVDKSLVVVEEQGPEARYRFLETVRQYARDRLLDSGDAEGVRGQHLDFFVETAQKANWRRQVNLGDLRRMDVEQGNLRAALELCKTAQNSAEIGLRLISEVWWGWYLRSHIREGREYLMYFLSREEGAGDTVERAGALNGAGFLANKQGDLAEARSLLEQSLEIARRLGREDIIGAVFNNLGDVASNAGDYASARIFYEECLAFRRKKESKWGIGWALIHLGRLARLAGEYERAASLDQESLSLFREVGAAGAIPWALLELGKLSRAQEDCTAAHSFYQEGLKILRDNGSESTELSGALEAVAALAVAQGQGERAARLYGVAETMRKARGMPLPPCELDEYNCDVAVVRAALGDAAFAAAWAEGRAMPLDEAVAFALQERPDA
jgi:predicted ATPase/DNA-binding SARP family transcriptional activator